MVVLKIRQHIFKKTRQKKPQNWPNTTLKVDFFRSSTFHTCSVNIYFPHSCPQLVITLLYLTLYILCVCEIVGAPQIFSAIKYYNEHRPFLSCMHDASFLCCFKTKSKMWRKESLNLNHISLASKSLHASSHYC